LSNQQTTTRGTPAAGGDEANLVRRAREGDHGAFRVLVERHMRAAYTLAYRFTGDHHAADEVAQEAFIRAHASLAGFRGDASFGTWLHRIVTNLALNRVRQESRKREREVPHEDFAARLAGAPPAPIEQREIREHVERALHELPTLQRAAVILRHLEGLSTRQVSTILECSEGTVKTHLFRGLRSMRERLAYLRTDIP
jgi:RNA polymerase sigma-70 factor (ECF subfamily)